MDQVYIALLQGMNVGKSKRISMAALREIVDDLGGQYTTTLVNSGNVVFRHQQSGTEQIRQELEDAVIDHVGQSVPVIIRTAAEMRAVVAANPYPHVADTKCLHVEFLQEQVPDVLHDLDFGQDHLTQLGREVYLHLPNNISGITYDWKLLSKRLTTAHTSRNWNTVTRLNTIASDLQNRPEH